MIRVMICDDEPNIRSLLREYLMRCSRNTELAFDIRECGSGGELTAQLKECRCDLLLLDIEMPGGNGMEAARAIRQRDADVVIVFITNLVQYALEGYEVQAWHFLEKPITYEQFARVIQGAAYQIEQQKSDYLSIKNENGLNRIHVAEILYAETYRGHVLIHCRQEKLECFQTMAATEKMLEGRCFFRCHTAYLVNLARVEKLGTKELTLSGGMAIPVSKHRRHSLAEALTDYWGGVLL